MTSDIDKAYLFLNKHPKRTWLVLDDLGLKDIPKFIELVKHCMELGSIDIQFTDDYKKLYLF